MLSLGGERLTPKVLNHYLHPDLGMQQLLWFFFAHLLIVEYPDHHQSLINSLLYYLGPLRKISSQSVHNFQSNVVQRQTDRQTKHYQQHNLLCQEPPLPRWSILQTIHSIFKCSDLATHIIINSLTGYPIWLIFLPYWYLMTLIKKKNIQSYIQMLRSCNTHHTIN